MRVQGVRGVGGGDEGFKGIIGYKGLGQGG